MALKLLDIDSETIYAGILQAMEVMNGEPLYPGDERRVFAEAMVQICVAIANQCNAACNDKFLEYASDEALDALGARMNVTRLEAVAATAEFLFTLSEEQTFDVTVPAGTLITNNGDIYFSTDEDLVIAAGETTGTVTGSCTEAGEIGNDYSIGTIAQLADVVEHVSTASNTTATSGGSDIEDDDDLRERIRLANSAYSTAGSIKAYQYWAKTAHNSIIDVVVDSPDACIVNLYILCEDGELPSADILTAVEEICGADDVRPLTDVVTALAPAAVSYDIELKYYTTAADEAECIKTIEGPDGAVEQFVKWQSGAIGRDINPDKLLALCMAPTYGKGCIRATVTSPSRVEIGALAVAQVGNITITHEVVAE